MTLTIPHQIHFKMPVCTRMFTAAFFLTVKWKQPNACQLTTGRNKGGLSRRRNIRQQHKVLYPLKCGWTTTSLCQVREARQEKKITYCIIPFIEMSRKGKSIEGPKQICDCWGLEVGIWSDCKWTQGFFCGDEIIFKVRCGCIIPKIY